MAERLVVLLKPGHELSFRTVDAGWLYGQGSINGVADVSFKSANFTRSVPVEVRGY